MRTSSLSSERLIMVERLSSLSRSLYRPMLNGRRFLSDQELSERLKISHQNLAGIINEGKLPYIQLGGKVLYKESDIERMFKWVQKKLGRLNK